MKLLATTAAPFNLRLLLVLFVLSVGCPDSVRAKEVRLQKGEIYRDHDLTVICEGLPAEVFGQTLEVRTCQRWDNFSKKCLFEKTTYTYKDLECVEECLYWDSFKNTCDYQNKCTFYPAQEAFVLSTCSEFDGYSHKCLNVSEEKITK